MILSGICCASAGAFFTAPAPALFVFAAIWGLVVGALARAREMRLVTVALTGQGGARLSGLVDFLIDVPGASTPRIQEVHAMVVHVLCQIVEEAVAG